MKKQNTNAISILTAPSIEEDETLAMFPTPRKLMAKHTQVATDKFAEGLSGFIKTLEKVIQALPESCGGYNVDTLTFSLSVNASGKISLIVGIEHGIKRRW